MLDCSSDPFKGLSFLDEKRVKEAIAIDPNKTLIRCLRRWSSHPKITYLAFCAENLLEIRKKFDYIFCHFSLEHFQDIEKGIKNISKCLKKGGKVLLTEAIQQKNHQQNHLPGPEIIKMLSDYIKKMLPRISEKEVKTILKSCIEKGREIHSENEIKKLAHKANLKLLKEHFRQQEWFAIFQKM